MSEQNINWNQYRALLRSTFLIEMRGRTAVKPYRRTVSLITSYMISSAYLAWNLSKAFYEPAYVLISFTVSMYLAGFTVITSYSFHLLDATDELLLHQFPINEKTLFAVRSTNLFLYILLISVPFYIPLAVFFYLNAADPATVVYMPIALFFSSLWTSCLFLIVYNLITQLFSNTARIFSGIQIMFILLLLFFYQSLPRFDASQVDWQNVLTGVLPYVFPPIWFSSLFWSLQQYTVIPAQRAAMLLGSTTLILFLLLLRSRLLLLPRVIMTADTIDAERRPLASRVIALSALLRPRPIRKKGGFDFLRTQLLRDRLLQIHLLPVLLMPIAVAIYGILTGQCDTPFHRNISQPQALMHLTIIVFFLFATRHIIQTITHTRFSAARWIFEFVDSRGLEHYSKGVYASVVWNVLFPLAAVLFLLFSIVMPPVEAALQSVFLLLGARFQIATWTVFQKYIPFSMPEDKLTSAQRFTQFLFIIPYIIVLTAFHWVASESLMAFVLYLLGLEIATQVCMNYLHRARYSIPAE